MQSLVIDVRKENKYNVPSSTVIARRILTPATTLFSAINEWPTTINLITWFYVPHHTSKGVYYCYSFLIPNISLLRIFRWYYVDEHFAICYYIN